MAYKVKIDEIAADGTNLYVSASVSNGTTTFPRITPVFPADTPASEIDSYFQTVADNAPTLPLEIANLVSKTYTQA